MPLLLININFQNSLPFFCSCQILSLSYVFLSQNSLLIYHNPYSFFNSFHFQFFFRISNLLPHLQYFFFNFQVWWMYVCEEKNFIWERWRRIVLLVLMMNLVMNVTKGKRVKSMLRFVIFMSLWCDSFEKIELKMETN